MKVEIFEELVLYLNSFFYLTFSLLKIGGIKIFLLKSKEYSHPHFIKIIFLGSINDKSEKENISSKKNWKAFKVDCIGRFYFTKIPNFKPC